MAKIKLKITHIIDGQETNSFLIGIKQNNKISYFNDGDLVILEIINNSLKIKRINSIENNMIFGEDSLGYFVIGNETMKYQIKTNNLYISDAKIEVDYIVGSNNKYILEVLND